MSFVDDFLTHYSKHKDFSKASKFQVEIFVGGDLTSSNYLRSVLPPSNSLKLQCEAAELPGYNFDTVEGRIFGAPYAVAARPAFNDLRLTFICSGDLWERKFFDSWQEFIMPKNNLNRGDNYLVKYRDDYVTKIRVTQYLEIAEQETDFEIIENSNGGATLVNPILTPKPSYIAEFIEAFPTSVDPIALSWADDGVNRLSVNFKYSYWKPVIIN